MFERATKTWVLALTSLGSFTPLLDAMVVAAALGAIRLDLGTSIEVLQWTVNAYRLDVLFLESLAATLLAWKFLFWIPTMANGVIAACLAAAWAAGRPHPAAAAVADQRWGYP
jgi:hypothetical protein